MIRGSIVSPLVVYYIGDVVECRSSFDRRIVAVTVPDIVVVDMRADISSRGSSTRLFIYFLSWGLWTLNSSLSLVVGSIVVACHRFLCDLALHIIFRTISQFCPHFTSFSCSGCVYFENLSRFILIFKNSNLISLLIINSLFKQSIYNSLTSFRWHTCCNTRLSLMGRGARGRFLGFRSITIVENLLFLVAART